MSSHLIGQAEMRRQRLLVEAKEEFDAAVKYQDHAARAYANVAVGLLNGLSEEPNERKRADMLTAVGVCLEAARHLLWGDPKVTVRDVA